MMNAIDACYQMYKDIEKMITEKTKTIRYDRTFRAKITSQISANKYKILYKKKEHPASCDIKAKIGDMVWVCAPENNWNRLYIQSSKSDDDTITQVNGIKGSAETSYKSGYVNISPEDIGLGNVPNVATNDQTPTFTQTTLVNILSGEKLTSIFGKISKWIDDYIQHKNSVNHITEAERTDWNDANIKKHIHSNKSILDGITQNLIDRWNAAETNVQSDWNVTDTASDAFIKNKPSSLPANGGTADILSNAVQIADYNTFIPTKIASGAITPVKAGSDANSPWNNTTSGFLVQSNSADSWHLLIFRSGGDGWAYRSYYQNVWNNWRIWSTFDGKYSSLTEKPTSFPPSTHTHTKSQITDMPTKVSAFDNDSRYLTAADIDTSQNHTHANKSVLDTITQTLLNNWDSAYTHISNKSNPHGVTAAQVGALESLQLSNSDNLDEIKTPGFYYAGGGNAVLGKPNGTDAFGLQVYKTASGYVTQDLIAGTGNPYKRYTRQWSNSVWINWIPLPTFTSAPVSGQVIISDGVTGGIKSSGFTIAQSVPSNAAFTDTVYTHPDSGATAGTYRSVTVNAQGHVTGGTNPTTFDGNSATATKLQNGRTIAIGGGATGTATSFDGSANVSIPITAIDASYLTGYSSTKRPYFNTHPENGGAILPFINNDLAFLTKKGGSMTSYKTTSTDYTLQTLINSGQVSINTTAPFDGSPSYASFTVSDTNDVIIIDIVCHKVFTYSNNFYIDFGNTGWRAKDIRFYTYNSNSDNSEVAYKLMGSVTNSEFGQFVCSSSYTYVNSSGTTVQGFNKLRVVLTNFQSVNPRIAAIGVLNYSSPGLTETFLSRGGGTVYGNISPHSNNAYTLGATSNRWSNGYFETINVNSASKVPNLNSDKLDDQDGSYYLNYKNMTNTPTSKIITVTTSDWTSTAPYTKTILVPGMKSTDEPSIFPYTPKTMTSTQITTTKKMASYITDGETNDGSLTLYCGIVKPTSEFQILLIGVSP